MLDAAVSVTNSQNNSTNYLGYTTLYCLSLTQMMNKQATEAGLLNFSLSLDAALSVTKFITTVAIN